MRTNDLSILFYFIFSVGSESAARVLPFWESIHELYDIRVRARGTFDRIKRKVVGKTDWRR